MGGARQPVRLGELLVQAGHVTEEQVERALGVQQLGGGRLGSILVNLKFCTEAQIRDLLGRQMGVDVVELGRVDPDAEALERVPKHLIRKYEVVPISLDGDHLTLAMMDPYNLAALDDIKFATGVGRITAVTCTEDDFRRFLEEKLQTQTVIEEILDAQIEVVEAAESDEQAPIIKLCRYLLLEAINRRASDIHIEPYETYFRVRMRIDGRLMTLLTPPQRLHAPMVGRFKVMAEMDISKRRVPQDGALSIRHADETVHYRVSTLPTVYGEKCVIRLLKKDRGLLHLDTIGFTDPELHLVRRMLRMPQGIILVTGPTGSGKTTTLHAGLYDINDPEVNIVTLEDPVEASIEGINHVKVNPRGGVTFASGLKSILRQDPDVVFIGEMRDPEVASIAVKAALTGHLVLSTLHTNSAAESLTRLQDMGIPPYLVASSLVLVIAQRLLRRNCLHCERAYTATKQECAEFQLTPARLETAGLRKATGCEACNNTGFRGRLPAYEILRIDPTVRDMIRQGESASGIVDHARKCGMHTLFEAGLQHALRGKTTLDEVRRVCAGAY